MKNLRSVAATLRSLLGLRPRSTRLDAAREIIGQSKLFDPQWYAGRYPDVAAAGCDPLSHFVQHGAAEGRNPSERFDLRWYMRRNPDVARSGANPLLHYLEHGRAEGRSIRSVSSNGSDDPDDEPVKAKPSKAGIQKARVEPYASDFDPKWQARPAKWSDLRAEFDCLEGRQRSAGKEAHPSATEWITDCLAPDLPETAEFARIRWFCAMQRDSEPVADRRRRPNLPESDLPSQAARRLLTDHGLGLDQIIDGWFAGFDKLVLRIRPPAKPSARIRAFQFDMSGSILCCADAPVSGGEMDFVHLALDHELCPVLLTWMDDNGTLTGCTVIPFPSLFRGGLHHTEIMTVESADSLSGAMETYATALALDLPLPGDSLDAFAISQFQVDLSGANGTEPLFSPAILAALASQFGIRLVALPNENGILASLAERFDKVRAGSRVAKRVGKGGLLRLPADGFPSLRVMVARTSSQPLGTSSFCIANAADRQPEAFVCMPVTSPELSKIQHSALPAARPVCLPEADKVWPEYGPPVMIRFRDDKVWNADILMPVSPDVSMPLPTRSAIGMASGLRAASVIVSPSDGRDNLPLLLASLNRQSAGDQEVLFLGILDAGEGTPPFRGTVSAVEMPEPDENIARRLNRGAEVATGEYLVFIDAAVSLPDPRTLDTLLTIASQPGIASVACNLVSEDGIDGQLSIKSAGIISQANGMGGGAEWTTRRADFSQLFPVSTYPVVANDIWLFVVPRRVWTDLGGFSESASAASLDFASRARASGLTSICTGLVSAAISQNFPGTSSAEESTASGPPTTMAPALAEQVTSFWRLGR